MLFIGGSSRSSLKLHESSGLIQSHRDAALRGVGLLHGPVALHRQATHATLDHVFHGFVFV